MASQVFQSKTRLALFLERVVVKALASTALDGLDLAVGGASTAVEKVLKTTLGGVDRQASRLGGPVKDVVQGSTGAALNTSVGALEATKSVVDGVTHGAKTITSGVFNGVTKGRPRTSPRVWATARATSSMALTRERGRPSLALLPVVALSCMGSARL